ncbi:hypothetical protein WN55_00390 [Dufourea novaeangliae]|uniref:Uncharacterized protein n=1 Tax=Dufourea novaeangliae TaxID=178035 RepID=A0A154PH45_DUFNO|nr:hypothetical protein WN55_00390 [Dufourea novaeangliae]
MLSKCQQETSNLGYYSQPSNFEVRDFGEPWLPPLSLHVTAWLDCAENVTWCFPCTFGLKAAD